MQSGVKLESTICAVQSFPCSQDHSQPLCVSWRRDLRSNAKQGMVIYIEGILLHRAAFIKLNIFYAPRFADSPPSAVFVCVSVALGRPW